MNEHWRAALRQAARLHIAPAEFWRLSAPEWRALSASSFAPLARPALEALMRRYPDPPPPDQPPRQENS
ncbi:MAG: phage tail assembly chaperone [Pseudomonadota bacterium]|jgi:uncharacterized phage protein (TIGR02216 family)